MRATSIIGGLVGAEGGAPRVFFLNGVLDKTSTLSHIATTDSVYLSSTILPQVVDAVCSIDCVFCNEWTTV